MSIKGSLEGQKVDVQIRGNGRGSRGSARDGRRRWRRPTRSPLLLVNRVGSGRAVLLNFQLPPWVRGAGTAGRRGPAAAGMALPGRRRPSRGGQQRPQRRSAAA